MSRLSTLLLAAAALATGPMQAQPTNGGFENWNNMGTYEDPADWITQNNVSSILGVSLVEKGTPGNPGNFYVKLTTKNIPGIGPMVAAIVTGYLTPFSGAAGSPINFRPAAFTGNWKYQISLSDSALITVALTKWNPVTQERDGLGGAVFLFAGNQSNWSSFSIPIGYSSPAIPDTVEVWVYSGTATTPALNNSVHLDNLGFSGTAGIEAIGPAAPSVRLYPSLASEELHIEASKVMSRVMVWDAQGRIVLSSIVDASEQTIDVSTLPPGTYAVRIIFGDGSLVRQRFVRS